MVQDLKPLKIVIVLYLDRTMWPYLYLASLPTNWAMQRTDMTAKRNKTADQKNSYCWCSFTTNTACHFYRTPDMVHIIGSKKKTLVALS